jgi:hypothetical protein
MECARSVNGVPIRLTEERWVHISEEHCEMAGLLYDVLETIGSPQSAHPGTAGELPAARRFEADKHIVVVYKETGADDGFVITAFLTRRVRQIERRERVWPR